MLSLNVKWCHFPIGQYLFQVSFLYWSIFISRVIFLLVNIHGSPNCINMHLSVKYHSYSSPDPINNFIYCSFSDILEIGEQYWGRTGISEVGQSVEIRVATPRSTIFVFCF
ncbi:unnamed protein product [Schistosoma haematobium]|nr:unnamed protein product [Schistosoma haematobium]CAH8679096.1 unnamed protein product [Schistosoma haematobium]